jgi:hypothetical protein
MASGGPTGTGGGVTLNAAASIISGMSTGLNPVFWVKEYTASRRKGRSTNAPFLSPHF